MTRAKLRPNPGLNLWLMLGLVLAACLSVAAGKIWVPFDAWTAADPQLDHHRRTAPSTNGPCAVGRQCAGSVWRSDCRDTSVIRSPIRACSACPLARRWARSCRSISGFAVQLWLLPGFALIGAGVTMALLALIAGTVGKPDPVHPRWDDPDQHHRVAHRARDQSCADAVRVVADRDVADGVV